MRIKICGITRVEDALTAAQSGADAIGLVFYEKSPRAITITQAQDILAVLPPFVTTVGLFVNAHSEYVQSVLSAVALEYLQFHGDESASYYQQFDRPFLKAVRVRSADDIGNALLHYGQAKALLLDAYDDVHYGGTGQQFDWQTIPQETPVPLIVAGGLHVDNVHTVPRYASVVGVDVSSGVEHTPGIKSAAKMQAFCQAIRSLDEAG